MKVKTITVKKTTKKKARIIPLSANNTQPLKDIKQIQGLLKYVKAMSERDYLIFKLALNTGLRVSDFRQVKVSDIKSGSIRLQETKTGKIKTIPIQNTLLKDVNESSLLDDDYICRSNKGGMLTRGRIHAIIEQHGRRYGINHLAPHSLRKTYGYHHYKKNKDIVALQRIFKHGDLETTLRYIGMEQEEINESMLSISF